MIDLFAGMNERQKAAIEHVDGPLLVVAGAGSGKTRVITHRVARLIELGNRPDRILAITFTNKAAGEMQERIERLLGIKTPWITTFHAAGLRLLKLESARLPFAHPFTVMDVDDQKRLFKRVVADLGLDPARSPEADPKALAHQVSAWKNRLLEPKDIAADPSIDLCLAAYHRYYELCREECVADFDDLLLMPVKMLSADEELRQRWSDRFPYVLIDEYQDTNEAQYRLVRLLGAHGNVCATGDPDQAIYGWRGADIHNILNFERDFPGCKTVLLEQNYRSTQTILRAAQGVVEHNTERKEKTIFTENAVGDKITLVTVDDGEDEAMAVAAACERLVEKDGRSWRDIAIFYRTNAQSRALEEWLIRRGAPYRIIGGTRFYDRREVKDLLAYLKLLINPRDLVSFERVVNVPRRGIGDKTLELLRDLADDEGVGMHEVLLRDHLLERVAVGRASRPLRELARLWRRLVDLDQSRPAEVVAEVLDVTSLPDHYLDEDPEQGPERVGNLQEVASAADQFAGATPGATLGTFLEHVALITAVDNRLADGEDALVLMTLHASKGLEFPIVFVTGCEQGVLPLVRTDSSADYEEERRLMYVGITRAQEKLYLSRAVVRSQFGRTQRNPPSMFLAEIPDDCIEHRDRSTMRSARLPDDLRSGPTYPEESRAASLLDDTAPTPTTTAALEEAGLLMSGAALKAALRAPGSAQGTSADQPVRGAKGRRLRAEAEADAAPVVLAGDTYQPGQRLRHALFGEGVVVRCTGPAGDRRLHIDFDDEGPKELLERFAAAKITVL